MNTPHRSSVTIGIASGKGGVGKTTVAANLAASLVKAGSRVMLFDADLGLANAQLTLGCSSEFNFGDVLTGHKTLSEVIVTTRQGIRLVPGTSGVRELASLGEFESSAIVQAFSSLSEEIDYFLVDSAAGIADAVITFLRGVHYRFVVVCDEPASIADAYGLIKVMVQSGCGDQIFLVPNMVPTEAKGKQLFDRVNDVCQRFLGISLGYLGSISHDPSMKDAVRLRQPVTECHPVSPASRDFSALAGRVCELPLPTEAAGGIQFFIERWLRSPETN
jgi:flagellar biosynthesis protein FlhG